MCQDTNITSWSRTCSPYNTGPMMVSGKGPQELDRLMASAKPNMPFHLLDKSKSNSNSLNTNQPADQSLILLVSTALLWTISCSCLLEQHRKLVRWTHSSVPMIKSILFRIPNFEYGTAVIEWKGFCSELLAIEDFPLIIACLKLKSFEQLCQRFNPGPYPI